MKRIALTGAPGSGKSALATALLPENTSYRPARRVRHIDGYADGLRSRTQWAFGYYGGWIANLAVAFERTTLEEQQARLMEMGDYPGEGEPVLITCGTLVDTIAYTAMTMNVNHVDESNPGENDYLRVSNTMHMLGMLFHDTWPGRYDHVFYLPTSSEQPLDRHLSVEIQAALNQLGTPYVELPLSFQEQLDVLATTLSDDAAPPA